VAVILATELGCTDADALAAALNHDVLEDCPCIGRAELAGVIGERACAIVCDVTKWPVSPEHKAARDRAYLDSLPTLSHTSRLVKLADRIDNLRAVIRSGDPDKARRYLAVSLDEFVPLADQTDPRAKQLVLEACRTIAAYLEGDAVTGMSRT
jgi:(p)ppGpp synthase/HD superfamily hydrolase